MINLCENPLLVEVLKEELEEIESLSMNFIPEKLEGKQEFKH